MVLLLVFVHILTNFSAFLYRLEIKLANQIHEQYHVEAVQKDEIFELERQKTRDDLKHEEIKSTQRQEIIQKKKTFSHSL